MTGSLDRLDTEQLRELVARLSWNPGFGCYTRAGFEHIVWPGIFGQAEWFIFFDIDDMHRLNEAHGYENVDVLVRNSLELRAGDYLVAQWKSGDEFVVCVTKNPARGATDPRGLCARLKKSLAANGISATFGIAPVMSPNLLENVIPACELVQQEKRANRRGRIVGGQR